MSKLNLHDNMKTVLIKMSDGNLGCVNVLINLMQKDMETFMAGMLWLDNFEIYGTDIYVLSNDKCDGDIDKFILLIKSITSGVISREKILWLAKDQMRQNNLTEEEWGQIENLKIPDFYGEKK